MAWSERVLSGRPSRHPGEPWATRTGGLRGAVPVEPAVPADPLADEAIVAMIAEARRAAELQGYEAGRAAGEQALGAAVAGALALAQRLETAVPRDVDMVARTVAELAVLIARRVVGAELRHDPSVLIAAIEAGLRQASGASVVTVELHPLVVDEVERVWVARHGTRHRGFTWSFTGDPTLAPDGCRLRTEHGLVEAGFEDQLAEVAAALDAAIPGYLGAVVGPAGEGAEAAERAARHAPDPAAMPGQDAVPPRTVIATPFAPAPGRTAVPADGAPAPTAGPDPAGGVSDAADLDALASLGLERLDAADLDTLEASPGGPGEGAA